MKSSIKGYNIAKFNVEKHPFSPEKPDQNFILLDHSHANGDASQRRLHSCDNNDKCKAALGKRDCEKS